MKLVEIKYIDKTPKLKNPIFIEGLPGIGNVGKLAVEHLIDFMKAKKFAELYSKDFPPQVFINPDGTVKLVNNEFYYWKTKKLMKYLKRQKNHTTKWKIKLLIK